MKDVKEAMLSFASPRFKGCKTSRFICLEGPPGVGKTSIAISLAKVLNMEYRISSLVSETEPSILTVIAHYWVGASPSNLKKKFSISGTTKVLFVFDEINKFYSSHGVKTLQGSLLHFFDAKLNKHLLISILVSHMIYLLLYL